MTCEDARALIDRFVLDELSTADARRLAAHVRACAACTSELAGASRLIELLATLPELAAAPDFDARIFAAVVADRQRRRSEHGLGSLWRQIWRGAMRTTGTLVVTLVVAALLSAAFVFAASNVVHDLGQVVGLVPPAPHPAASVLRSPSAPAVATVAPPTRAPITPSPAPTAPPTARAAATPAPSPSERPSPSARVTAAPVVIVAPPASPSAAPAASAAASPTPSPTPKCRRTPAGPLCYPASPSPSATGSSSP